MPAVPPTNPLAVEVQHPRRGATVNEVTHLQQRDDDKSKDTVPHCGIVCPAQPERHHKTAMPSRVRGFLLWLPSSRTVVDDNGL